MDRWLWHRPSSRTCLGRVRSGTARAEGGGSDGGGKVVQVLQAPRQERQRTLLELGIRLESQKPVLEQVHGEEQDRGWDGRAELQAMVRLTLRHEQELGMLRAETGFMLFLDAPSHHELSFLPRLQEIGADWTEKCAAGTVKSPLKTLLLMAIAKELKTRLEAFRDDTERLERAMTTGWISQGSTQMDPSHPSNPAHLATSRFYATSKHPTTSLNLN